MRQIGQIEHPILKITVFKNDGRTSVKFENAWYEQTFKLGDDERVSTLEGVRRLVETGMAEAVMEAMQAQHRCRLAAFRAAFGENADADAFEIIV